MFHNKNILIGQEATEKLASVNTPEALSRCVDRGHLSLLCGATLASVLGLRQDESPSQLESPT